MQNKGYIKLARKIEESDIWQKPLSWRIIWIHILLKANWSDTEAMPRGSNFFSYTNDSPYLKGVSKNQWHECITWLKNTTQITTQKTTRGIIIKVLNYARYQDQEDTPNRHGNRHKSDQTPDTIKEEVRINTYTPSGVDGVIPLKAIKKPGFQDLSDLQNSKAKHINLIGYYFSLTRKTFSSPESLTAATKRWMKVASEIGKFSDEEINQALETAQTKYPAIWDLGTVYKILTK
jgi:hypothetical protein